jgi:alcohol dehydrogenase class IV
MKLRSSFRYLAPASRLYAGPGSIQQVYAEAQRIGAKRAFIVASETLSRTTNLVDKVSEALRELHVGTFAGAKKESPVAQVMAGRRSRG